MLASYLKLAFKVFLRRKFFTAVSLFGISFTLVVLTVAIAVFDHAVAPLAPETRQDRTLGVYFARMSGSNMVWQSEPGYLLLDRCARGLPGVERTAIFSAVQTSFSYVNGRRITSRLKRTDAEFWRILEFRFLEGGPYTAEDVDAARFVAVISAASRSRFFGDGPAVGRSLEVDGQRFRVVGVVPDVPEIREVPAAEIWAPLTTSKIDTYRRELMGGYMAILLARSAADFPAIKAEFRDRLRRLEMPDPKNFDHIAAAAQTRLERAADILVAGSPARQLIGTDDGGESHLGRFFAAAGLLALLFMLLPTVNLVNLNVSRILERASEIGVRKAFGATAGTLVGQFVLENVLLTLIGGLLGFVLAAAVLQGLTQSGLVAYAHFALNGRVFLCGLLLAIAFGVLSGSYPAWRMARLHPVQALGGGAR
jgi:putative ABC transport system permease protein